MDNLMDNMDAVKEYQPPSSPSLFAAALNLGIGIITTACDCASIIPKSPKSKTLRPRRIN
jgi:hypothetical protein